MAWEITPQGYIKTTAKITKSAILDYYGHELGFTDSRANQIIKVNRNIEELSKPETLKSFEGMPLTITHPKSKQVTKENYKDENVGNIQNVRVDGQYIVCDAIVKDESAIELLKDTEIRELSVGYEPSDIQEEGGKYYHRNIRANHVAIVAEGRAGSDCRLQDHRGKLMTIKDILALLKGKRINDSEGATLTADDINQMISALETALKELEGKDDEDSKAKAEELQKQIDELKAQLSKPTDEEPTDEKDARIAELVAENEALKTENQSLKAELEELKANQEKESTLNDAKARFPKVNLTDAKSARDVRVKVLVDSNVYTEQEAGKLTDAEIRAAYAAIQVANKPKSDFGKRILQDSKPTTKSASARLGGK